MTLIPPTRKRTRSCEEEEFLPLSKKINNLHINNWGKVDSPQEQLLKWSNPSEQILNFYSEALPNGKQGNESRNASPFEGAQESIQNNYNQTELNSRYSQEKYMNGEGSNSDREQSNWPPVYNPDLDLDENPYYYESNKLLFDLNIERLQRNGY